MLLWDLHRAQTLQALCEQTFGSEARAVTFQGATRTGRGVAEFIPRSREEVGYLLGLLFR